MCFKESELTQYGVNGNAIDNCLVYYLDNNTRKCKICDQGLYPEEDGLSCVSDCTNTLLLIRHKNEKGVDIDESRCVAGIAGCELASPILDE